MQISPNKHGNYSYYKYYNISTCSCRKLEIFSSKFLAFLQNVLGPILLGSLSPGFLFSYLALCLSPLFFFVFGAHAKQQHRQHRAVEKL